MSQTWVSREGSQAVKQGYVTFCRFGLSDDRQEVEVPWQNVLFLLMQE